MHQYLKAIGFENIQTRKDLKKLLKEVEENFAHQTIVSYRPGEDFCEFQKEFGLDVGKPDTPGPQPRQGAKAFSVPKFHRCQVQIIPNKNSLEF